MWGGLVADNAGDHALLQGMLDSGALGFKSFMVPSGVPVHRTTIRSCQLLLYKQHSESRKAEAHVD